MPTVGDAPLRVYTGTVTTVAVPAAGFVLVRISDDASIDGEPVDVFARGGATVGTVVTVALYATGTARII